MALASVLLLLPALVGLPDFFDLAHAEGVRALAVETTPSSVIAYGHLLTKPFVLSGVDGDTLRINGYPYEPRRAGGSADPQIAGERPAAPSRSLPNRLPVEVLEERKIRFETALFESVAAARNDRTGASIESSAMLAVRILEGMPYVESARAMVGMVEYKYVDHPVFLYMRFSSLPAFESPTPEAVKSRRVADLSRILARPGLLAFGSTYTIEFPPHAADDALAEIQRIQSNAPKDSVKVGGRSAALRHRGFWEDILAPSQE